MTPDTLSSYAWYSTLVKPWFAPPAWLFGPVWTVLYVIIAITFGIVFLRILQKKWPASLVLPFGINIVANLLFTPLQFGLRSNGLAALDILVVLGTIIWMMKSVYPHSRTIAYWQIPYLLWVSFATVLQLSITLLNGF